jgi:hypothetical protein
LASEQFLEARLVLERPIRLGLIVGQRLSKARSVCSILCMVPDGIVGVEMRGIGSCALDEQVGHGSSRFVSPQDFESPETCSQARRIIVAARQDGADERFGRFFEVNQVSPYNKPT